jgi:steroid 5-alpha reductase family enzyme
MERSQPIDIRLILAWIAISILFMLLWAITTKNVGEACLVGVLWSVSLGVCLPEIQRWLVSRSESDLM